MGLAGVNLNRRRKPRNLRKLLGQAESQKARNRARGILVVVDNFFFPIPRAAVLSAPCRASSFAPLSLVLDQRPRRRPPADRFICRREPTLAQRARVSAGIRSPPGPISSPDAGRPWG